MKVEVRLFAQLRERLPQAPRGRETVELDEGTSLAQLLDALDIPPEQAPMILVNGARVGRELAARRACRLAPGDVVAIFPPVAGG